MNIDLEFILAALADQNDGELFLGAEFLRKNYEGKVLAMTADPLRDGLSIELVKESEVTYDDE